MHTLPVQIRFNDIDQMGHVNNAVIMEYFDLGKEGFFTSAGLPPEEGDFTVMIVHYEVDFQRQIHFHDAVSVETSVERFGTKSLTLLQRVVGSADGLAYATCRTVMAGYSRSAGAAAVVPDDVRRRLLEA
ncbi:MAG: acyl-CoA thioesterase [Bacteroidales bacterium]|nr:acyl-CoA thioesterase [Bacteroidales bacterium]